MNIIQRRPYRILTGDVREMLRTLPDESVQCVVTSPPYWGLRDYGVEGQLGLEPTIELYVEHMVEVFREVRRVLRKDGTLWLNMGDCYAGGGRGMGSEGCKQRTNAGSLEGPGAVPGKIPDGLSAKQLVGQPWRVAFALQADGWWLRSDIVWAKPNPMPESCRDRPTKAHEYVFLLTKAAKYFFDQEAVREGAEYGRRDWSKEQFKGGDLRVSHGKDGGSVTGGDGSGGRNIRSVWTIPTQPFAEAHFATFPEVLPERCIKAGTSEKGCCPECGAPWVRVSERTGHVNKREVAHVPGNTPTKTDSTGWAPVSKNTNRWRPSCKHKAEPIPCTILDPFVGSGTTALVAIRLGRRAIGIDLSAKYTDMVKKQLAVAVLGGSRRPRKFQLKGRKKMRRLGVKRT